MFSANTSQVSGDNLYVEDVFSTYLYTGNGSKQTINNGIELGSAFASGGYITLDGTNYLKSPTSSAFAFGTGDFTMEAWIYPTSVSGTTGVVSTRVDGSGSAAQVFFGVSGGAVLYYANVAISGGTVLANNWYHVACTRSGTTVRIFLDGVQVGSGTDTADKTTTFGFVGAGAGDTDLAQVFKGRISNARFVKGTALYTSNFTPSTTPLTAVSGTSLLTCQSPNLTADNSANAFTLTQVGTVQTTTSGGPFADATKGKGGLVWEKERNGTTAPYLMDTARGSNKRLDTTSTAAQTNVNGFSFNSTGYTWASSWTTSQNIASWTFRKAPKFFDVVTFTAGTGTNSRVPHSLGIVPGTIILKIVDQADNWYVYHRSLTAGQKLILNSTASQSTNNEFSSVAPTATDFGINADWFGAGTNFVAYLFAHDTTSDGIIQCGSFTTDGSAKATVNLGWEPQWLLSKQSSGTGGNWAIVDSMRGFVVDSGSGTGDALLRPNISDAEIGTYGWNPTATGFEINGGSASQTFIYIAIRRGPMRTPTSGTSVFSPNTTSTDTATTGFPVDFIMQKTTTTAFSNYASDRLRGATKAVKTNSTDAESTALADWSKSNTGVQSTGIGAGASVIWSFRRAPSFFDVVCYTGTGVARTVNHNLGIVPELMIVKNRSTSGWDWHVYAPSIGNDKYLVLNEVYGQNNGASSWDSTSPTATTFTVGTSPSTNNSGSTHVAYLFASCPGVSKCGSYTGNGSSQTINCGFAAGARFVMIKRTDSTGDWYVWDTARGIVAGNDPHLSLNSTAAEVTTDDSVDTDSSGFVVNQLSATNINVSSATYIYLAVA